LGKIGGKNMAEIISIANQKGGVAYVKLHIM